MSGQQSTQASPLIQGKEFNSDLFGATQSLKLPK
jgi:hypothetical protein